MLSDADHLALLRQCRPAWAAGHGDRAWALLARAERDFDGPDGTDPLRALECSAARAGMWLLDERPQDSAREAERCLSLAAALDPGSAPRQRRAALAAADARVTLASNAATRHGSVTRDRRLDDDVETLRMVAADFPDTEPGIRAVNNRLLLRLEALQDSLDTAHGQAEAWTAVSEATTTIRSWSPEARSRMSIHRQALDLAMWTGQWQRGWDLAHQQLRVDDSDLAKKERVSALAKGAVLAWHRGLLPDARDLGTRAREASIAVDLPWVRTYAYLGGVIAAAAGAGSVEAALRDYSRCTDLEGHATRRRRVWHVALVALDAGHPVDRVEAFVAGILPGGVEHPSIRRWARIVLAEHRGEDPGPGVGDDAPEQVLALEITPERARLHLAHARGHLRAGRVGDAAAALVRARWLLRDWPGRLLESVDEALLGLSPGLTATPAQRRVLDLIADGAGNAAIAAALGLSERTVAVHVGALLRANGAASRTELAVAHLRHRLLTSAGS